MQAVPSAATAPSRTSAAPSPWLHGRGADLLCGAGLGYVLAIPLLFLLGSETGWNDWPRWLAAFLAVAISTPHYGATLLRVYDERRDRQRYAFFAVYVSALLLVAFAAGLRNVAIGSLLLTLYVSWSPWHFAGQNYGLGLMFMRRAGVSVTPELKRSFYLSFLLSFLLAFLALHLERSDAVFAQGVRDASGSYEVLRLGVPTATAVVLAPVLGAAYLACLARVGLLLRAQGRLRDSAPAFLLVLTQALWFSVPACGVVTGAFGRHGLIFGAVSISAAHSLQYLWVTSYYARRARPESRHLAFLTKALLAGSLVTVGPAIVAAPGLIGGWVPPSAGVGVLVFSVVNLHHFVLDGAIWKLRDGPVARALLRDESPAFGPESPARRPALRGLVWALGVVCLLFPLYVIVEKATVMPSSGTTLATAEASARRLAWLGRDDPNLLHQLADRYLSAGRTEGAIASYRRILERDGSDRKAALRLVRLLVEHGARDPARVREAVEVATRASERRRHADPHLLSALASALDASGDEDEARLWRRRALELATAQGRERLVRRLEEAADGNAGIASARR